MIDALEAIKQHALECYPRESCGLVVVVKGREQYVPCKNIATANNEFMIDPADYAAAEDRGAIIKIVHSHPDASPHPSEADNVGCEKSGLTWLIISVPTMQTHEFKPSGYQPPLLGRVFHHGVQDCYTFIRDYYKQILNVGIPDFDRADNWWQAGDDLYLQGFPKAGFTEVNEIQQHDVLLMQIASPVPNHAAIYVGDGKIQHHQTGRLSSCDVYGGWYRKITTHILRHQCIQ